MSDQTWRQAQLQDLVTLQRGFDITKAQQVEGMYPVISSSGVKSYHSEYRVSGPGVVVGRKGTLGTVFYSDSDFWPHDTTLWVKDFHGNDYRYCYYFLKSMRFEQYDVGAANPTLNRNHIHGLPIRIPSPATQCRIASILSAYDDLIENNTRRIEILEEMSRRLYEEWFVHFRFPGHDVVGFKESGLGSIPEVWEIKTVAETFQIMGGGTPSKKVPEYWEGGDINWFSPTDLTKSSCAFMDESSSKITELGLKKSSAKLFHERSVMMTSRATIGVVAINTQPATTNQGFITCLPNDDFPLNLMYHWLKDNVETFISFGTGATFKEISKGTFKEIQLAVAPRDISRAYEEAVNPIMQQVLLLQRKNANLCAQRDLLLPKLVSGEIDVSDISMPDDKEVEAA